MKYLIVEKNTAYSVALKSDGSFINVLNQNHEEGQYVDNVIPIENIGKKKDIPIKRITALASAAACVLIAFLATTLYMPDAYGTVYITVNPEVTMDVSKSGKVVKLSALNDDGEKVIDGIKWRKRDALIVADEIMDKGIALGLIKKDSIVRLDIDTGDDSWFSDMGLKLRTNLNGYLKGKVDAGVQIYRFGEKNETSPPQKDIPKKETKPTDSSIDKPAGSDASDKETNTNSGNGTKPKPKPSSPSKNSGSSGNKNKDKDKTSGTDKGNTDDSNYGDNSSYDDDNDDDEEDDDSDEEDDDDD